MKIVKLMVHITQNAYRNGGAGCSLVEAFSTAPLTKSHRKLILFRYQPNFKQNLFRFLALGFLQF